MSYLKIQLLIDRNRPEEAERAAIEALKSDPEDPRLRMLLCVALYKQDKFKAAENQARNLIGIDPESDLGFFWLARCLEERSCHKEAIEAIDEALAIDPEDAESWAIRASNLIALNKRHHAREAVDAGLAADPDNESCRFYRSVLLGLGGEHSEADEESLALLADDPDSAENHNARGWVLFTSGDAVGAERHFIEALRIEPGYEDARIGLVEALKSRNPFMSGFLRFLLWLGRFPWWYVVVGIVGISFVRRTLSGMDHPVLSPIGDLLGVLVFGTFMLMLTVTPVFNLALATSKRGRMALSDREKTALRWAALPLVASVYFLIHWAIRGGNGLPVHGVAWACVASFCGEVAECAKSQVRRRMTFVTIAAALVAVGLLFVSYLVILPQLLEAIRSAGELDDSDKSNSGEALTRSLMEVLQKKKWFLDYPALALLVAASFREDIRKYFERRADD